MRLCFALFLTLFYTAGTAQQPSLWKTVMQKATPHTVKLQYAGNIGMFAAGIGYSTSTQKWKADLFYGVVPARYAVDPIHSLTIKGKFAPLHRRYNDDVEINWFNTGLLFNYSFGDEYFLGLPAYYDKGYYYFSTALNIGLFIGSEIRYKKWGFYYELGTTEKRVINYVKNTRSINLNELWNIGLGAVFHIKPR